MDSSNTDRTDARAAYQVQGTETFRRGREFREAVAADNLYRTDGRLHWTLGYDRGTLAPKRTPDHEFERLQYLSTEHAIQHVVSTYAARIVEGKRRRALERAIRNVVAWLAECPGATWDDRWILSGLDAAPAGGTTAIALATGQPERYIPRAIIATIQSRLIRPSYSWLLSSPVHKGIPGSQFLEINDPGSLHALRQTSRYEQAAELSRRNAETCIARLLIRTGKRMGELTGEDVLAYADLVRTSGRHCKEHLAWEVLVELGPLAGEPPTLKAAWNEAGRSRRHSVEGLVARYGIPESGVRDLLVDYLREVQPGMDYGSLEGVAYRLVRLFWAEVLHINPEQADLRLSPAVAQEWRRRLATTVDGKPRRDTSSTYFAVRGMYRDLAEWSHQQPERWAIWVAPTPVPRAESRQISKANRRRRARMQQRTRILTPMLPRFLVAAVDGRRAGAELLTKALAAEHTERFTAAGVTYERHAPPLKDSMPGRARMWASVVATAPDAVNPPEVGARIDITSVEADGFWGWAVASVLSETGIRIEELLELTQLSLRHFVAPATNTIVPLLHIVPSKTDAERLVPMSPDLVKILVEVQRRARGTSEHIPLSVRYDHNEKEFSDPLPHLFARTVGATQNVLSPAYVQKILGRIARRSQLQEAGEPVHFTPHDFRRLFATDLVGSGLPLHIVSTLLGHLNLETTRGYTAVFPEQVVQAHHAFIERRRQIRPGEELRPATADEWKDFEQSFLQRKVALGGCQRPYATPCIHEHACVKCRFLQVDPAQLARIEDMTANAEDRLEEAKQHVWLGEVSALEDSLIHLRRRREEALAMQASAQIESASPSELRSNGGR